MAKKTPSDDARDNRWIVKLHTNAEEQALIQAAAAADKQTVGGWLARLAVRRAKFVLGQRPFREKD